MPHEIDRIIAAVAGRAWMIDPEKGLEIANMLALREAGEDRGWAAEQPAPVYAADAVPGRRGAVHVLRLHGTVIPRGGMMSQMSGGASLDRFSQAFREAADDRNAQAIVMDIDSPGGVVDLVQETADMIYGARRAGRPIIAVANTMAASAAYWIASAADEIVVSPSGTVGSIGVYSMHDDLTSARKKFGVDRTMFRAGARKAEGALGPMDDPARRHRQAMVDQTYEAFVAAVARNRSVAVDVVRADPETTAAHFGGGRAYHAEEAVRLGLADRVETFDEAVRRASDRGSRNRLRLARARIALS